MCIGGFRWDLHAGWVTGTRSRGFTVPVRSRWTGLPFTLSLCRLTFLRRRIDDFIDWKRFTCLRLLVPLCNDTEDIGRRVPSPLLISDVGGPSFSTFLQGSGVSKSSFLWIHEESYWDPSDPFLFCWWLTTFTFLFYPRGHLYSDNLRCSYVTRRTTRVRPEFEFSTFHQGRNITNLDLERLNLGWPPDLFLSCSISPSLLPFTKPQRPRTVHNDSLPRPQYPFGGHVNVSRDPSLPRESTQNDEN